jgi:uncharacterized protein YggE
VQTKNNKINLNIDLRIVVLVLLAVIVSLLFAWMPWETTEKSDEVIKVTGETVVKSEPDQYVFYPSYQFKSADKAAASDQAAAKSDEVVKKLEELGVGEAQIKSSVDGYGGHLTPESDEEYTYTANLVVTVGSRDMAQKIQDYIATTGAQGSVTPQGMFSEAKRKELEAQARDEATKDARKKADQSAENLGFKLGRVKSVEDGAGFSSPVPVDSRAITLEGRDMGTSASRAGLPVMPGENELSYSVTVTYFLG